MSSYFILKNAVDTLETGNTFPQVLMSDDYNFKSPDSVHNLTFRGLPTFTPNLDYFKLDKNANLTDLISQTAITAYGILVSQRFKKVLSDYNLINHAWFEANVVSRDNSLKEYHWLHIDGNDKYLKWVDFKNSDFFIKKGLKNLGSIEIKSLDDYFKIKRSNSHLEIIKCKKLYLHSNFDNSLDLFLIPYFDGNIYISKRLKNRLLKAKLTGFELKKPSLFFSNK